MPEHAFPNTTLDHIRTYGYGIPSLGRAIDNSVNRVTLVNSGSVSAKRANVYSVRIPNQLRTPGEEHDILIEITLAFMARPRRTRRKTQSYLSTWLDWHSSRLNESHDQFCARVIKDLQGPVETSDQDAIPWVIRENSQRSTITGLKRQDSSLQKSWCVLKSFSLPEEFSLAVVGHQGWSKDLDESIPYSIVVSFEALNSAINVYEMIRVENEVPIEVPIS